MSMIAMALMVIVVGSFAMAIYMGDRKSGKRDKFISERDDYARDIRMKDLGKRLDWILRKDENPKPKNEKSDIDKLNDSIK